MAIGICNEVDVISLEKSDQLIRGSGRITCREYCQG